MTYVITDYDSRAWIVARVTVEADTPEQARIMAGPMPTLNRTTVRKTTIA